MNNLLKYDSNIDSIKSARLFCHIVSISFVIFGFLSWSLSPYLMKGKNPSVIFGRYVSLIFTGISGISILFSSCYLKKTNYIITANEKVQENILLNQIASSQYFSQQYHQEIAKQLPSIMVGQEINNSGLLPQYENNDIQLMPELPENLIPLFNIACEKGQLSLRDIKRKYKDLDNDTALDMLSQMEKLGYGQIEKKGLSIKFIPKMD